MRKTFDPIFRELKVCPFTWHTSCPQTFCDVFVALNLTVLGAMNSFMAASVPSTNLWGRRLDGSSTPPWRQRERAHMHAHLLAEYGNWTLHLLAEYGTWTFHHMLLLLVGLRCGGAACHAATHRRLLLSRSSTAPSIAGSWVLQPSHLAHLGSSTHHPHPRR